MSESPLQDLDRALSEEAHLVIANEHSATIEVIAVKDRGHIEDAFPLPISVQDAAYEVAEKCSLEATWLDVGTAGHIGLEQLPEDFWLGAEEKSVGENLTVTILGRAGRKYLYFYRAVRDGDKDDLKSLQLRPTELVQVAQWVRVEALFDRRSGDDLMAILSEL